MFYILYSFNMNNENTPITKHTGQGDTLLSRYSSPSAGKRERIMKHTVKQIEDQIETVEECLINLALLEVCDPVYSTILKTLRMLDTRLEEADEKKSHTDES